MGLKVGPVGEGLAEGLEGLAEGLTDAVFKAALTAGGKVDAIEGLADFLAGELTCMDMSSSLSSPRRRRP